MEWTARKEMEGDEPILRVYAEGVEDVNGFAAAVHESLVNEDAYYRDLQTMIDIDPLRVTAIEVGAFRSFYDNRRAAGYVVDVRSMPRVNPTDDEIAELTSGTNALPPVTRAEAA